MSKGFKCGKVVLVGKANVGKSLLFNALIGRKISLVTKWPRATFYPIEGAIQGEGLQVVLVDTPPVLNPRDALQRHMVKTIRKRVEEADVAVFVGDVTSPLVPKEQELSAWIRKRKIPCILVLNKIDLVRDFKVRERQEEYREKIYHQEILPVSALFKENIPLLLKRIMEYLPEKPPLYPPDFLSSQTSSSLIAETIREQITNLLWERRPESIAVVVKEIKPSTPRTKMYIRAHIYVEHENEVPRLIGVKGALLKEMGRLAIRACEQMLGEPVFLRLVIRARGKWRNEPKILREFGYIRL